MLRSFKITATLLVAALCPSITQGDGAMDHVLEVHGSGTTNPSKCIWLLQQQIQDRTRVPIHMTYRAVGSSTGIYEFLGVNNTGDFTYLNYNDFASADIPLPQEDYQTLSDLNIGIIQLPFLIGSVGVFYNSLTDTDNHLSDFAADAQPTVNLTACDVAKIFRRKITKWDDEELLPNNPNLRKVLPSDVEHPPIHVARRVLGSSSTASLTAYLNAACPSEWPAELVGTTIEWPEDTMECEGSAGMSACLVETPGAIGYMESGHGWAENFKEVELKNANGRFLSSRKAAANGGIASALQEFPDSADKDFSSVNLINKPGEFTWPITLMSYIFVRKDLTEWMDNTQERTLLKAFLQTLYDPDLIDQCTEFGFVPVPERLREVAVEGIDMLIVGDNATEWIYEKDTIPGEGQGRYVISLKRRKYDEVKISDLVGITDGHEDIVALWAQTNLNSGVQSTNSAMSSKSMSYTSDAQSKLNAALVMSALSIALWCILIIGLVSQRLCCHHVKTSE